MADTPQGASTTLSLCFEPYLDPSDHASFRAGFMWYHRITPLTLCFSADGPDGGRVPSDEGVAPFQSKKTCEPLHRAQRL